MVKFSKFIELLFFLSVSLIPFLPEFGVIDITGVHYFYLTITQSILFLYLFFQKQTSINQIVVLKNPIILYFSLFILICGVSIISAFNKIEAIIEFYRYFIILITLINFFILFKRNPEFKNYFFYVLIVLLAIESFYIFKIFLDKYSFDFPPGRLREFQGFSYNQNIGAFSILIKIPILLYFIIKTNKKWVNYLGYFIFSISIFDLLIIGSRGSLIATLAIGFFLLLALIFNKHFQNKSFKIHLFIIFSLFTAIVFTQQFLYQNQNDLKVINRVSNYDDDSVSYRFESYKEAIQGIIDYPILGVGIGNWKVTSILYAKDRIQEYQIPYHVHNDFLHIGVEIGLLGLIMYLLIFLVPSLKLMNLFLFGNNNRLLYFFLLLSIVVYSADAMVNFPRARPYSQMNFIYIFALIAIFIDNEDELKFPKLKAPYILLLIIVLPSSYIAYKVYDSYKIQKALIFDFNFEPSNFTVPISYVNTIDDGFPNLSTVTFPIKTMKANYFYEEGLVDEAMALAKDGNEFNPHLGLMENLFSKVYFFKKKNIDSAYKYAKLSHEKLPLNNAQASIFQLVLAEMERFEESKKLFYIIKSTKNETIWQNFLIYNSVYKFKNKIAYDSLDKATIAEALSYFPENQFFKQNEKIINYGENILVIANTFDFKAQNYYSEGDYLNAIENWEEAIKIIPDDDSYYLNIAQSYLKLNQTDSALDYLKKIDELGLREKNGKYEFLMGIYHLLLKNGFKACNFFNESQNFNYKDAKKALIQSGCY